MSLESLFAQIPAVAVYRRVPLAPQANAFQPWQRAVAQFVKPVGEQDLWGKLTYGGHEANRDAEFLSVDRAVVAGILEQNAAALALLDEGLRLGRLQFPEFVSRQQMPAESEFICKLGELARFPFVRFKVSAADGDFAAAGRELARLLRIGEMVCNGDGQILHYLVGLWLRSAAVRGMARLGTHPGVPGPVLAALAEAVQRSLTTPDGLAQSLRVDFYSISLPQLDRTIDTDDLETVVDRILEIYYTPRQDPGPPSINQPQPPASDDWLSGRRRQMLFLLQGHDKPFDKLATARTMGRMIAEMIHDVTYFERKGRLDLAARIRYLQRRFRRHRLARQTRLWTVASQSLPEDKLAMLRDKLRRVANPLGLLLVAYLLAFDYSPFMFQHRARLRAAARLLRRRSAKLR
ncbi:MAG: hypothetical protein ABSF26_30435 [Thermoguttaceae bacterium]|jgi:hypothetical protein